MRKLAGGHLSGHSAVRESKVRKYRRRVDIRSVLRPYLESQDQVRSNTVCRAVAQGLHRKLKECPPFVGTRILAKLKNTKSINEDYLELMMDEVWLLAEKFSILLIA